MNWIWFTALLVMFLVQFPPTVDRRESSPVTIIPIPSFLHFLQTYRFSSPMCPTVLIVTMLQWLRVLVDLVEQVRNSLTLSQSYIELELITETNIFASDYYQVIDVSSLSGIKIPTHPYLPLTLFRQVLPKFSKTVGSSCRVKSLWVVVNTQAFGSNQTNNVRMTKFSFFRIFLFLNSCRSITFNEFYVKFTLCFVNTLHTVK